MIEILHHLIVCINIYTYIYMYMCVYYTNQVFLCCWYIRSFFLKALLRQHDSSAYASLWKASQFSPFCISTCGEKKLFKGRTPTITRRAVRIYKVYKPTLALGGVVLAIFPKHEATLHPAKPTQNLTGGPRKMTVICIESHIYSYMYIHVHPYIHTYIDICLNYYWYLWGPKTFGDGLQSLEPLT